MDSRDTLAELRSDNQQLTKEMRRVHGCLKQELMIMARGLCKRGTRDQILFISQPCGVGELLHSRSRLDTYWN